MIKKLILSREWELAVLRNRGEYGLLLLILSPPRAEALINP